MSWRFNTGLGGITSLISASSGIYLRKKKIINYVERKTIGHIEML